MWSKLELLRNIDSIIDFSRATAQLRILIALDKGSLTVDEIANRTGLRRKTVLDALRKLELKGVICRKNGKYVLTDMGKSIYEALSSLMYNEKSTLDLGNIKSFKPVLYDLYTDILSVSYMLETVKLLGRKRRHSACIDEIASKMGISKSTLETHLRGFTEGRTKLLKKVDDKKEGCTIYELTELGLTLYKKIYSKRGLISRLKSRFKSILGIK